MRLFFFSLNLLFVCAFTWADEPAPPFTPVTYRVPYRLSPTEHIIVRAKLNGQGPFDFVLDTGAPSLFVVSDLARGVGVTLTTSGKEGMLTKMEVEGGPSFENFAVGVDAPDQFQLQAVNTTEQEGRRIVGFIGASVLRRYRVEIDYTRPYMVWTETAPRPARTPVKPEITGPIPADLARPYAGARPGFLGIVLKDAAPPVKIASVLKGSPAEETGLQAGDVIVEFALKPVNTPDDVAALATKIFEGTTVNIKLQRDGQTLEVKVRASSGF